MKSYSQVLKEIRNSTGLSLRDFANKCGLSHAYIDKLEKGVDPRTGNTVSPSLDTIRQICNSTGYPLDRFLKETGYIEPTEANHQSHQFEGNVYFRIAKEAETSGVSTRDMQKVLDFLIRSKNRDDQLKE